MNKKPSEILRELINNNDCVRIAALGSSNTQRRLMGMHWFDYIELGCKAQFGKGSVLCCNMGVGGETASDLLNRFDRDCGRFAPHLAIITCGGNDSKPAMNFSRQEFAVSKEREVPCLWLRWRGSVWRLTTDTAL